MRLHAPPGDPGKVDRHNALLPAEDRLHPPAGALAFPFLVHRRAPLCMAAAGLARSSTTSPSPDVLAGTCARDEAIPQPRMSVLSRPRGTKRIARMSAHFSGCAMVAANKSTNTAARHPRRGLPPRPSRPSIGSQGRSETFSCRKPKWPAALRLDSWLGGISLDIPTLTTAILMGMVLSRMQPIR
jgi:hypothetical protein